jgi:adenosylcobinamide-GDP ribazoletransferase
MSLASRLDEEVQTFLHALTFYTRIPSPVPLSFSEKRLGRCTLYLPVVGWLIGSLSAFVLWGSNFLFPKPIALTLSMLATLLLTGAMHEDGFADFCDGFGGGWTREKILEIMKDSRLGTYGAIGLWAALSMKWLCLSEIPLGKFYWALIAGHSVSRFFSASFLLTHEYVGGGSGSKAGPLCRRMSKTGLTFTAITGLLPLLLLRHVDIFLALVPLLLLHLGLGLLWKKKLGGFTGDCLGAAQQLSEVAFYLFILGQAWISI